eukprot:m.10702 g.10702  ORF g.10702 m.10702 type:complete len:345 (-) comp5291_c0_seq2:187-1221(-)
MANVRFALGAATPDAALGLAWFAAGFAAMLPAIRISWLLAAVDLGVLAALVARVMMAKKDKANDDDNNDDDDNVVVNKNSRLPRTTPMLCTPPSSFGLGMGLAFGYYIAITWSTMFGLYFMVLCLFHFSEFFTVAYFSASKLSFDFSHLPLLLLAAFLLNHSKAYWIAAISSWTEFWLELYFVPGLKVPWISVIGFLLVTMGDAFRKAAMWTAADNFSHQVATVKVASHQLVTHGVYSLARHPAYFGWWWWSTGTQIMLCNPICTIGYAVAATLFFRDRVPYEEERLLHFFQDQYDAYQQRVGIWIPFVSGYQCTDGMRNYWRMLREPRVPGRMMGDTAKPASS